MKFSKTLAVLTAAALICLSSTNAGETVKKAPRRPTPIDLRLPVATILAQVQPVIEKLNITMLIGALLEVVTTCLPPPATTQLAGRSMEASLAEFHAVMSTKRFDNIKPLFTAQEVANYCQSPDFEVIHNFIWVQEKESEDLLNFFWRFGFPSSYSIIKLLYQGFGCPKKLIDTLPVAPKENEQRTLSWRNDEYSNIRELILTQREDPMGLLQEKCNLIQILLKLYQSGALELLQLVKTVIEEVSTKPGLHFLIGKIQEPAKGESFRKFRLLGPVRFLMHKGHQALISDETIHAILEIVMQITGIDLINTNILETVVGLVELILWQNPDAVPPYEPTAPPPTTTTEVPPTTDDTTDAEEFQNIDDFLNKKY